MFDGVFEGTGDTFIRKMFFPVLEECWVAERIVQAVERGEKYLVMPKVLRFILPLAYLLPIELQDIIASMIGGTTGMKNFRGRPAH